MARRLILYTSNPGHTRRRDVSDTPVDSRIGVYFWPTGKKFEWGQIVRLEMTYSDGHTRTYVVEEVDDGQA